MVACDCEVLVAFSEPSRIETRKFKSYHTNNLTLLLLCSLVAGRFLVDSELSLERVRFDFRYRYLNQSFSQSHELGLPN